MKAYRSLSQDDKESIQWGLYVVLFWLIILVIALCTLGRMVMGYEVAEIFESYQNADWEANLEWADEFKTYPCGETQKEQLLDMIASSKYSKTRVTEELLESSRAKDNSDFELTVTEEGLTVVYARRFTAKEQMYLLIDRQGEQQILRLRSPWAPKLNDFVFIYGKVSE